MTVHTVTVDFHVRSTDPAEAERKMRGLLRQGFGPGWPTGSIILRGIQPHRAKPGKPMT